MGTRQTAGFNAKLDGHALEAALALRLGSNFIQYDDGNNKTDLKSIDGRIKISLKNSDSAHTQVALIAQQTLINYLNLDKDASIFVKMFFGFSDGTPLNQDKLINYNLKLNSLDPDLEISRNRILFKNIPSKYSEKFLSSLNNDILKDKFYQNLIKGDSNVIAWTMEKNNISSIKFALMSDILDLLKKGKWEVSNGGSTLELKYKGDRLLYVQMKGSSKRFSAGYHSCMFHLYRDVMNKVNSFSNLDLLKVV